jgi:hypothetical protein
MPSVTGFATGGLPILSYKLEASPDNLVWTALCGFDSDYSLTYFLYSGLTTGDAWFFRYSVRNSIGWS